MKNMINEQMQFYKNIYYLTCVTNISSLAHKFYSKDTILVMEKQKCWLYFKFFFFFSFQGYQSPSFYNTFTYDLPTYSNTHDDILL